jgi:hypothetical protein
MRRVILAVCIAVAVIAMVIIPATADTPPPTLPPTSPLPKGQPFEIIWSLLNNLQAQITYLGNQIANIQLTPGPQGSQGPQGLQGPKGDIGATGAPGLACWDLNGNGVCDLATEDINNNGVCNANDCQGPPGVQGQIADLVSRVTALESAPSQTGAALGTSCKADRDCASGDCIDGVCCDQKCEGNCRYCAFPGHEGTCMAVPDWQDPRQACPYFSGGHPLCAGRCYQGQCTIPDKGTPCDVCAGCDGTGRCTWMPWDDPQCGVIQCSGLNTPTRVYRDFTDSTGDRCMALGDCKPANDPRWCTNWVDIQP